MPRLDGQCLGRQCLGRQCLGRQLTLAALLRWLPNEASVALLRLMHADSLGTTVTRRLNGTALSSMPRWLALGVTSLRIPPWLCSTLTLR